MRRLDCWSVVYFITIHNCLPHGFLIWRRDLLLPLLCTIGKGETADTPLMVNESFLLAKFFYITSGGNIFLHTIALVNAVPCLTRRWTWGVSAGISKYSFFYLFRNARCQKVTIACNLSGSLNCVTEKYSTTDCTIFT